MCVNLLLGDLNPDPYPLHPTNTYTYGVTIALRMCRGHTFILLTKQTKSHFYNV